MTDELPPQFAMLAIACAAYIQQHLYQLIELQAEEIRILKKLYGKQVRPQTADRQRLAALANALSRQVLEQSEHIVTIDTFRRWYRTLISNTYTGHNRGRPRIPAEQEELILQLANENPYWGSDSISDRMKALGFSVSDTTVANVLKRNGYAPAPKRSKANNWKRFIKKNWAELAAMDYADFEIPNGSRTTRVRALYTMKINTREVALLGVEVWPNGSWATNRIKEASHPEDGFLSQTTALIMDRDPTFTDAMRNVLTDEGIKPIVLPPRSPNLNAHMERFIGTVRRELEPDSIPWSLENLRHALEQHLIYYNEERNHQSLPGHHSPLKVHDDFIPRNGEITQRSRLGNRLNYYYRKAA